MDKRRLIILLSLMLVCGRAQASSFTYGGGGCTDVPTCVVTLMTKVWGLVVPTDPAPPTVINVKTGTGGGYTNCVSGGTTTGCMTGQGQIAMSACTISTSNLNVSCPTSSTNAAYNTGPSKVGWNYDIIQQNGLNNGTSSSYTGCEKVGTIASVTDATHFVANAPTGGSGTCGANLGANDTTATVSIWDGKDGPTAMNNAMSAAGAKATAWNTGAIVYLPAGIYVWTSHVNYPSAHITIQCQSPATTMILNPDFGVVNSRLFWLGSPDTSDVTIKNCTFSGSNTTGHWDITREQQNWLQFFGGANVTIEGNVFEYTWGNEGINFTTNGTNLGACPCPYGQACNASNFCEAVPTNIHVIHNVIRYCQGNGVEVGDGNGVVIEENQFLDCDPKFEVCGASTADNQATMGGNVIRNNDIRCDGPSGGWSGKGGDGYYQDLGDRSENGCSLTSNNDNACGDMSKSIQSGNHIHADAASPAAYCWANASSAPLKPVIRGNLCVSGDHCSDGGIFSPC